MSGRPSKLCFFISIKTNFFYRLCLVFAGLPALSLFLHFTTFGHNPEKFFIHVKNLEVLKHSSGISYRFIEFLKEETNFAVLNESNGGKIDAELILHENFSENFHKYLKGESFDAMMQVSFSNAGNFRS